jgi:YHS domain-containing protein
VAWTPGKRHNQRIVRSKGGWIVMKRASPARWKPWTVAACAVAIAGAALLHPQARGQQYVPTDPPEHPRLAYGDSLVSLNDRCPVRLAKLNATYRPVYINGQPVSFCCMPCPGVFVQDPERYLKALQIVPPSLFQKGKKAALDSSLRHRIGFEIYYFSNRAELDRFKKDPLRYCGELTDPVTMARFRPTASSPRTVYADRAYYFASETSQAEFLTRPEQHKDRRNGMN